MAHITKRFVDTIKVSENKIFFDDNLTGFGIWVSPSGTKTFYIQYRSGGRTRKVKLGRYGHLTVDEARRKAKDLLGAVAFGKNPAQDIYSYRRLPTVSETCDRFDREHITLRLKPSTQREYRRAIELFIKPAIGAYKISDVKRTDIAELHYKLRDKPYQANRVLQVLSKFFNMCELWGLREDGSNPVRLVQKFKERKRETFLSHEEMARLGETLQDVERDGSESQFVVAAFWLLIFTGCRLGEIQKLRWEEFKGDCVMFLDSKTGPKRVPLSDAAISVINSLPRYADNPFVICGEIPGQHATDMQKPWRRIRKRADLEHIRIHDLRHTFASNAVMRGVVIMIPIYSGFDTLSVAFQGALPIDALKNLETAKQNAIEQRTNSLITLGPGKVKMHVFDHGIKGGYAFILDTGPLGEKWFIKNSDDRKQWNLFASVGSQALAVHGYHKIKENLYSRLDDMGCQVREESVNRADYAIDFKMREFSLNPDQFVVHSHSKVQSHWSYKSVTPGNDKVSGVLRGRRFESVTVGKMPNRQIIVYDKSKAVIEQRKKFWFEIWQLTPNDPAHQVWRVEVRAGKKELKDTWNIRTFHDLEAMIGDVFLHATKKIKYLADDENDSNVSRRKLHPHSNNLRAMHQLAQKLFQAIRPRTTLGIVLKYCPRNTLAATIQSLYLGHLCADNCGQWYMRHSPRHETFLAPNSRE